MNLAHDVSQSQSMVRLLAPFLLGFRRTNGDPGITTGSYPIVSSGPSGTADWTGALEPDVIREMHNSIGTGFPTTGSFQTFAKMTVDLTSVYTAFGVMPSYMHVGRSRETDTEIDVEQEVPVLLPPQRQYTQVFRVKHLGRARPLISPDDMVPADEL
jgi:hypothetical protein